MTMRSPKAMSGRLLPLLADVLELDRSEIDEGTEFETLGTWDSQREVEVALMLEYEFDLEFSEADLASLTSVSNVREILRKHDVADP